MAMAWTRTILLLTLMSIPLAGSVPTVLDLLLRLDNLSQFLTNGFDKPPPEAAMTTMEIVRYYGYQCESHTVTTVDGYVLELHRIPPPANHTNGHPVLLQHGFIGSSAHFVSNGRNDSLALVLSDEGYDVWMGNIRGNIYSRRHQVLSPDDDNAYWDFSLDELAMLDLPAMIEHILKTTQRPQLSYVGHSMGCTISAMLLSKRKDYCNKFKRTIWLGPVLYGTYVKTSIRILAKHEQTFRWILDLFYGKEVFWAPRWAKDLMAGFSTSTVGQAVVELIMSTFAGFSEDLFNTEYSPVLVTHSLEGTSWSIIKHYIQIFKEEKIQTFDMGPKANRDKYGPMGRSEYKLGNIDCPVNAFWGKMDTFTDSTDFQRLSKEMKRVTIQEVVPHGSKYWSHLDFIISKNARNNLYNKIVAIINES